MAAPNEPVRGGVDTHVQSAVEEFIARRTRGESSDPAEFASRFAEDLRPRILAQCREFLAFDGLLGEQTWDAFAEPEPDRRSFGDFLIQEELGRGGMGVVYLAHQRSLNRRVALKVMASGLTLSKRHVERFRREAAAAAQLRHPAIVSVHSFTEVDGTLAFAMDYVAGRNLGDILDDLRLANPGAGAGQAVDGTLGLQPEKGYVAECALLCAQLASALAVAHQAGIVHRDLKPRNVMLDERRQARLLDFGLAKSLGEGSISLSGEITGTAHYMSPEQTLAKRVAVDHRTDIFALGVILYELLTLTRPFDGKNLQQVVYEICFKEPVAPHRRNPKVPRDLDTICLKALEKDPQNRYQTAAELEADLQRFLQWEPIHARPAGAMTRLAKWTRRHRAETAAAVAVAVIAAGLLGTSWYRSAEAQADAARRLAAAGRHAAAGAFAAAIDEATEALKLLPNDAAIRGQLDDYRRQSELAATKVQRDRAKASELIARSSQQLDHDRELALLLALAAVDRYDAQDTANLHSAVLDALGAGFRTTTMQIDGQAAAPTPRPSVPRVRWSPDRSRVAAACSEAGAILCNATTGQRVWTLRHANDDAAPVKEVVVDVAFHPGGKLVATAGIDRTARLWRTADGGEAACLRHDGSVEIVRFDGTGKRLLTASYGTKDGPFVAQVFDVETGRRLGSHAHDFLVQLAEVSPCGRFVASWSSGAVRLWEADSGKELARVGGTRDVRAIAFDPGGGRLAVGGSDGLVRIVAVPEGRVLADLRHSRAIRDLAFDAAGRVVTAAEDQTARLWDLPADGAAQQAREHRTFVGHAGPVQTVAFGADGQLVVTGGGDGVVRVFDASAGADASGSELVRYEAGAPVRCVVPDRDGHRVLVLAGNRAFVWDFGLAAGTVALRHRNRVNAAVFDHDGGRVLTASDDKLVQIWSVRDGRSLHSVGGFDSLVCALDVDAAGERFVAGTRSGRLHVHGIWNGQRLFDLQGHAPDAKVHAVAFARRGARIASGAADGKAIVWNANDGRPERTVEPGGPVLAVALTPDADLLATVAEPADAAARDAAANGAEPAAGRVQIWRTADGVLQAELRVSARPLRSVAFTGDGSAVLTAGLDGTARLVGLDGSVRREYSIPTVKIERAILSPDARFVLGFGDAVPHLFDAATGRELLRLTGHVRSVDAAAFHPDGSAVVTASRDQTARIWPTDPVAVARRMALRPLSTAERIRFGLEPEQPPR